MATVESHMDVRGKRPNPAPAAIEREAFKAFPYGLLVLDASGKVLCRNHEASRLIEAIGLDQDLELTCCGLLGCGRVGSVLADTCLSRLAIERGEALPEVRIDLSAPGGVRAMWVAAATIDHRSGSRVVLQLRPGVANDRRRRTTLHWMTGPKLRIKSLGCTTVESAEGPITGSWLDQRTGQLLKYLVAERHRAVPIEEIAENLWPDADFSVGGSVRYHVHALRRQIEPQRSSRAPSDFILSCSGGYRLSLDQVRVDADEFERAIEAGVAALDTDPPSAAQEIERGLAIYVGDFLADVPYAEWAMNERHRLHDLACTALSALADLHLAQRELGQVQTALERLAKLQPYDEGVHRRLMELDLAQGRRSDAVRRYEVLRTRIRRTFGHDPNFTPADLTVGEVHSTRQ